MLWFCVWFINACLCACQIFDRYYDDYIEGHEHEWVLGWIKPHYLSSCYAYQHILEDGCAFGGYANILTHAKKWVLHNPTSLLREKMCHSILMIEFYSSQSSFILISQLLVVKRNISHLNYFCTNMKGS